MESQRPQSVFKLQETNCCFMEREKLDSRLQKCFKWQEYHLQVFVVGEPVN